MKMMRTAEIQILNEDMIVAVVICNLSNCKLTRKKKIRIQQSPLQYSVLFAVRQSRVDLITFKIIS